MGFITENQYWEASTDMSAGYSRKTGLVATSPGAAIEFEFPAIDKEVRYINLMILKSNLPKWIGGVTKFQVIVDEHKKGIPLKELSFEITGSHSKDTPITYPVEVDLKDYKAPIGSTLKLQIT